MRSHGSRRLTCFYCRVVLTNELAKFRVRHQLFQTRGFMSTHNEMCVLSLSEGWFAIARDGTMSNSVCYCSNAAITSKELCLNHCDYKRQITSLGEL